MKGKYKKENKAHENCISNLKDLIKVQCADGNWNCDSYMHGMANGMLLAMSCFDGISPEFLDAPDEWLSDIKNDSEPTTVSSDDVGMYAVNDPSYPQVKIGDLTICRQDDESVWMQRDDGEGGQFPDVEVYAALDDYYNKHL